MMERIPPDEIAFHPHSALDEAGRPFKWRGNIYRGIAPAWAPFFRKLCEDGTLDDLAGRGLLVKTEIAPLTVEGFDLVLRHRKVPFATYPKEWSPAMFRDAILVIVDLWNALAERGLSLKDAHPWNILYDGCRPVWVDLTSIVPLDRPWEEQPRNELIDNGLALLRLMANGDHQMAKALLPQGLSSKKLSRIDRPFRASLSAGLRRSLPARVQNLSGRALRRIENYIAPPLHRRLRHFLEKVRAKIVDLELPTNGQEREALPPSLADAIRATVGRLDPSSVLDLGPDACVDLLGDRQIVRFDPDPVRVDRLYLQGRAAGVDLLPLVMDFVNPTPARGLADHRYRGAVARFHCEGVVAIGMVERVVFEYQRVGLAAVVDGLAELATRWVLVDLPSRAGVGPGQFETFREALGKRFEMVKVIATEVEGRELLLCEPPKVQNKSL